MSLRPEKILIADDEPDILEILKYNLLKEGYEVTTAKDGDEAIAKAKQANPDLVILDIMMPRKNGVEVCEILRAQPQFKNTLILFLPAHVPALRKSLNIFQGQLLNRCIQVFYFPSYQAF